MVEIWKECFSVSAWKEKCAEDGLIFGTLDYIVCLFLFIGISPILFLVWLNDYTRHFFK